MVALSTCYLIMRDQVASLLLRLISRPVGTDIRGESAARHRRTQTLRPNLDATVHWFQKRLLAPTPLPHATKVVRSATELRRVHLFQGEHACVSDRCAAANPPRTRDGERSTRSIALHPSSTALCRLEKCAHTPGASGAMRKPGEPQPIRPPMHCACPVSSAPPLRRGMCRRRVIMSRR